MPAGAYKRPPIIEAVIDIQFATPISAGDLENLRSRLSDAYPVVETRLAWNVDIGPGTIKVDHAPAGLKLSTPDTLDIVILYPHGITNSRLAPYNSWTNFRKRAHQVFSVCIGEIGYRPAKRLGVRYINRIDIPSQRVRVDEWLRLGITLPPSLPPDLTNYGLYTSLSLSDDVRLNIHSSTVESPLVQHSSLLLDIDVYIDAAVPTKNTEIWRRIDGLRAHKNRVFEASITDNARELFDRTLGDL